MMTEGDPLTTRKVDLEKNPQGTELKIAQQRDVEKKGGMLLFLAIRLTPGFL